MQAKKFWAILLAAVMVWTVAGCQSENGGEEPPKVETGETIETPAPDSTEEPSEGVVSDPTAPVETEKPAEKPAAKPAETPAVKPAEKPAEKPEQKPATEETTAPEEKPETAKTVGQILLADFKAKAGSAASAEELATALSSHSILPFFGATMPVEPGLLSGFGNTEIKDFREGAMFAPMIGAIPFVGYVFVLEDGTDAGDFVATLKKSADLRWNICVEAEEMVTGTVGNKVFFVMCPKEFSEE